MNKLTKKKKQAKLVKDVVGKCIQSDMWRRTLMKSRVRKL